MNLITIVAPLYASGGYDDNGLSFMLKALCVDICLIVVLWYIVKALQKQVYGDDEPPKYESEWEMNIRIRQQCELDWLVDQYHDLYGYKLLYDSEMGRIKKKSCIHDRHDYLTASVNHANAITIIVCKQMKEAGILPNGYKPERYYLEYGQFCRRSYDEKDRFDFEKEPMPELFYIIEGGVPKLDYTW